MPLATVEAIAADVVCLEGCMPGQWLSSWGNQPIAQEVHAHFTEKVVWIDVDGYFRVVEEGLSDEMKEVLQKDANHKLRFVAEPSADGKPFIQTYTFFSLGALKQFIEIAKRHRVDFKYTY